MGARIGVAIVAYERPARLRRCLSALAASEVPVDRVVVCDNSEHPIDLAGLPVDDHLRPGHNVGLPAGLGLCFARLTDTDYVLVLDDDTVLPENALGDLLSLAAPAVGAVTVPTAFTRKLQGSADEPLLFPWSPTLLSRAAVDAVGAPRSELFFGFDDWDYAIRVRAAGYAIAWADVEIPEQREGRSWDGRTYLGARNIAYLAVRRRMWHRPVLERLKHDLKVGLRSRGPKAAIVRRGLRDGVLGRMGPPPAGFMP
jgi:GT2 family glycosyltransferase